MKLTNEQIQAILDGAPKGDTQARARHGLRGGAVYWQSPYGAEPLDQAHAICDLREILELRREVERLMRVVKLYKNFTGAAVDYYSVLESQLEKLRGQNDD